MSSSRRSRLPQTSDRRPRAGVAPGATTRLATFALLVAAGLVALLFGLRFAAAAVGWHFSPFAHLGLPAAHASLGWLLAGAVIVLAVLLWLVLRYGDEMLWLPGDAGGVLTAADFPFTSAQQVADTILSRALA